MTSATYYVVAALFAALLSGTLVSGQAPGVWWWRGLVSRADHPATYWLLVAAQFAILILFLLTGKAWHLR